MRHSEAITNGIVIIRGYCDVMEEAVQNKDWANVIAYSECVICMENMIAKAAVAAFYEKESYS
ncbi:MAG: hypothetical protein SVY53_05430 [Chloroflexota bacterium]|nr:hypothetical protein [Chloroflexota bacterium]